MPGIVPEQKAKKEKSIEIAFLIFSLIFVAISLTIYSQIYRPSHITCYFDGKGDIADHNTSRRVDYFGFTKNFDYLMKENVMY